MTTNTTKAHCNDCLGERNHEVLFVENKEYEYEEIGICCYTKHELLKCLGCEQIVLRVSNWDDADVDEKGDYIISLQYYPPAISRAKPQWFSELFNIGKYKENKTEYLTIYEILKEIYIGLQNDSIRLATLGIRALLEYIMVQKVGDNGSFNKNLDAFEKHGYISSSQNSILNTVLETGHATMHRSYSPTRDDLLTCMDISENLVASIFIHPREAAKLTKKIPPRK
jgi:predicted Fe-S protein YdhL (DUF1289 family)